MALFGRLCRERHLRCTDGEFETTGEEIFVTVERCLSRTVTLRVTSDDGTTDTESVVRRNR